MKAMLCSDIRPADVADVMSSDDWVLAQKCDGDRLLVSVTPGPDGGLYGTARSGDPHDIPRPVRAVFAELQADAVYDGEMMADGTYLVFDLVRCGTLIGPSDPWAERYEHLEHLFTVGNVDGPVRLLPVARTPTEKADLVEMLQSHNLEGFVAKRTTSKYVPTVGTKRTRDWLKCKFRKDVDAVVMTLGAEKQNLTVGCWRDVELVEVGEVSRLTGDGPKLEAAMFVAGWVRAAGHDVGVVVVVTFLNSGKDPAAPRLYQPVKPRLRWDKGHRECTIGQLEGTQIDKRIVDPTKGRLQSVR